MKYLVTALLAVLCFAGLCRWIAGRAADRRHRSPDHDAASALNINPFANLSVLSGNRSGVPAAAAVTPKNHSNLSGTRGYDSHGRNRS